MFCFLFFDGIYIVHTLGGERELTPSSFFLGACYYSILTIIPDWTVLYLDTYTLLVLIPCFPVQLNLFILLLFCFFYLLSHFIFPCLFLYPSSRERECVCEFDLLSVLLVQEHNYANSSILISGIARPRNISLLREIHLVFPSSSPGRGKRRKPPNPIPPPPPSLTNPDHVVFWNDSSFLHTHALLRKKDFLSTVQIFLVFFSFIISFFPFQFTKKERKKEKNGRLSSKRPSHDLGKDPIRA